MVEFKQYIPVILLVLLAVISFFIIKPLLSALFLGALLAYAFNPIYKLINKKTNKTISALIICLIVLLIIFVPGFFLVKSLVKESFVLFTLVNYTNLTAYLYCSFQIKPSAFSVYLCCLHYRMAQHLTYFIKI